MIACLASVESSMAFRLQSDMPSGVCFRAVPRVSAAILARAVVVVFADCQKTRATIPGSAISLTVAFAPPARRRLSGSML